MPTQDTAPLQLLMKQGGLWSQLPWSLPKAHTQGMKYLQNCQFWRQCTSFQTAMNHKFPNTLHGSLQLREPGSRAARSLRTSLKAGLKTGKPLMGQMFAKYFFFFPISKPLTHAKKKKGSLHSDCTATTYD